MHRGIEKGRSYSPCPYETLAKPAASKHFARPWGGFGSRGDLILKVLPACKNSRKQGKRVVLKEQVTGHTMSFCVNIRTCINPCLINITSLASLNLNRMVRVMLQDKSVPEN